MPLPYLQNKKHIYAWRERNTVTYNEISRKSAKRMYHWRKICKEFRNILIDECI